MSASADLPSPPGRRVTGVSTTRRYLHGPTGPIPVIEVHLEAGEAGTVMVSTRSSDTRVEVPASPATSVSVALREATSAEHASQDAGPGVELDVFVSFHGRQTGRPAPQRFRLRLPGPGWELCLVPHFHADPIFWNTQAAYLETWVPGVDSWEEPFQAPLLDLFAQHLDMARSDPDYRFVVAEVDYLRPYFDLHPEQRDEIRGLVRTGRIEVVGGTYNQIDTNLSDPETVARAFELGLAFTRDALGAEVTTMWQLDCFGHTPMLPSLAAQAGMTHVVYARGPHHGWGPWWYKHADIQLEPPRTCGREHAEPLQPGFPTEYRWLAPDGRSVEAAYLALHYHAGWWTERCADPEDAAWEFYRMFEKLAPFAAGQAVLLPVGTDFTPPPRLLNDAVRWWNARYAWPQFSCSTPRHFFDRLGSERPESELGKGERRRSDSDGPVGEGSQTGPRKDDRPWLRPQSRDLNSIFPGTYTTRPDAKAAQRALEVALLDAEALQVMAGELGAGDLELGGNEASIRLEQAWAACVFGAHHDGVTGSHSSTVHVDLLAGWREGIEDAERTADTALRAIAERVGRVGTARVLVANTLSHARRDVVRVEIPDAVGEGFYVSDEDGSPVAYVIDRDTLSKTLVFLAEVPSIGYSTYYLEERRHESGEEPGDESTWQQTDTPLISNEYFDLAIDPHRGGAICSLIDRSTGRQLVAPGGLAGELVCMEQYGEHPAWEEGAWQLTHTGHKESSGQGKAKVLSYRSAIGSRLIVEGELAGVRYTQSATLWAGIRRVELTTRLDRLPADTLWRARFATRLKGAVPIGDSGGAVLARSWGWPDDPATSAPTNTETASRLWCGLGATATAVGYDGTAVALGPAEIVISDDFTSQEELQDLVAALAAAGVTATVTTLSWPRYGCPDRDSNLPTWRIAVGNPEGNRLGQHALARANARQRQRLLKPQEVCALAWCPVTSDSSGGKGPFSLRGGRRDVTGWDDLPVLVVAGSGGDGPALQALAKQVGQKCIRLDVGSDSGGCRNGAAPGWECFAISQRGCPGWTAEPGGTLYLNLARASTGWPLEMWPEPPGRVGPVLAPGAMQSHPYLFSYSVNYNPQGWQAPAEAARDFDRPLRAVSVVGGGGSTPARASLVGLGVGAEVVALRPSADKTSGIRCVVREIHGADRTTVVNFGGLGRLPVRDCALRLRPFGRTTAHIEYVGDIEERAVPPRASTEGVADQENPGHHSRYWLHSTGSGPIQEDRHSVYLSPSRLVGPGPFEVLTTIVNSDDLRWEVPSGWIVEAIDVLATGPDWQLQRHRICPAPSSEPGRYLIAALSRAESGRLGTREVKDVVRIDLQTDGQPRPALDEGRFESPDTFSEISLRLPATEVSIQEGETAISAVELSNHTMSPLQVAIITVSPWGTWNRAKPWRQAVTIPPGSTVRTPVTIDLDPAAGPGRWPTVFKIISSGVCLYAGPVVVKVRRRSSAGETWQSSV